MERVSFSCSIIAIIISTTLVQLGNGRSMRNDSSIIGNDTEMMLVRMINDSKMSATTTVTCEPVYGFLPCSTTLLGLAFMIVVYEVLLSFGERYISAGSDLFFKTFGTGVIGSSIFHLLGTVPQVLLILVTGIAASSDAAAEQASINMGLLVGTTAMSVTIVWGLAVAYGCRDLSVPQDSTHNSSGQPITAKPFSITGYGVTCDVETSHSARIMIISLIPFVIIMFSKLTSSASANRVIIMIALIVTLALLFSFFVYQGFQPWITNRRLDFVLRKYIKRNLLQNLLTADRRPDVAMIREIFGTIDQNNNKVISTSELKALVLGIQIEQTGLHNHDLVSRVMEQFDDSGDFKINEDEFVKGLSRWLNATKNDSITPGPANQVLNLFNKKEKSTSGTSEEQQRLLIAQTQAAVQAGGFQAWLNYVKASLLIIIGISITAILATPVGSTIAQFSTAVNIPSFLIGYVVIPVSLNFGQAFRTVSSAKHKTEKDISLTLSEIYNGVFMNNLVSLCIFLGLVYARNLTSDVSAEILVVVILCLFTGLYTSFNTKFAFWTCIVAFLLYPVTLLAMYFLTYVLGWT